MAANIANYNSANFQQRKETQRRGRLQNVVLGDQAVPIAGVTGNDVNPAKYLGAGTQVNQGSFNTKQTAIISDEWAQYLNSLIGQNGSEGALVQGITNYSPDGKARIMVDTVSGQPMVLPGSIAQAQANANGSPAGLVNVQNPYSRNGYVRVGGPTWAKTIEKYALLMNEAVPRPGVSQADMEHFVAQAGVYGFGRVFDKYGVRVTADAVPDGQGGVFTRYRLSNFTPVQIAGHRGMLQDIQTLYNQQFRNPDQQALGSYGAASLALRHADRMEGGLEATNAAVQEAWNNNRSVAGAFHWADGYKDFAERRGLAAFPMRNRDGRAYVSASGKSLATRKDLGFCNIGGSMPGVTGSAQANHAEGFRFYPKGRKYISRGKNTAGQQVPGAPKELFSCGPSPDNVVNPASKRYQAGGKYALRTVGLTQALDMAREQNPALQQLVDADGNPIVSAQYLAGQYSNWALNPEQYGTTRGFMLPANAADIDPNTGLFRRGSQHGFSRSAPQRRREAGEYIDPNTNLTLDAKVAQSNALLGRITGRGGNGGAPLPTGNAGGGSFRGSRANVAAPRGASF